jgi:RNA polymerase sigma factor (sigma-70 family)
MAEIPHIDAVYWARLKKGDAEALGYLYDSYVDKLFLAALRITNNRELAKDAMQEVFIELWNYRESLGTINYSQGYLVKVLRNILVKKIKREQLNGHMPAEELLACPDANLEDILISSDTDKEKRKKLSRALSNLTSRQMLILKLHFYEGLSYEQIADRLSMNYQSVNNLAFRTILRLRSHMITLLTVSCMMTL